MGLIDDIAALDGEAFVDSDLFGESVTYTNRAGSTRTINAVVVRRPPAQRPGGPGSMAVAEVWVRNSPTTGIAVSELNIGGDTLTVTYPKGHTARAFIIQLPTDGSDEAADAGMLRLWLT